MNNSIIFINNWTIRKIASINIVLHLFFFLAKCEDIELDSVVVVYRHGDRTPIRPYVNDPYRNRTFWPADWGMLTNTGKMQQYELGKYFRQRYAHFLPEKYCEKDIRIKSTDVDRTLMSAEANLAGLFPPYQNDDWNPNLQWQPIPIHSIPEKLDAVLAAKKPCNKYEMLLSELFRNDYFRNISHVNHDLYAYLTKHAGQPITDLKSLEYLYSTFSIERLYNYTLPDWVEQVFPIKMEFSAFLSFATATFTTDLARLKSGPFFYELLSYFHNRSMTTTNSQYYAPKFLMFSAHDTTIANLLNSIGAFQLHSPPYCATIFFELYRRRNPLNQTFFVNVYYRNTTNEIHSVQINGCEFNCNLNKFTTILQQIAISPKQWQIECNDNDNFKMSMRNLFNGFILEIIPSVIIFLICIIIIVKLINKMYNKNSKNHTDRLYIKLPNDDCSS